MGIMPLFTQGDLRNFVRQRVNELSQVIEDILEQVGEQFVADARTTNTYKDQTRNLRGSIGYIIVKDGKQRKSNLEGKASGKKEARRLMQEVKAEYPKGYALIVVAGMNYAAYVEAKGFDVLTGSSQEASRQIKRAFDRLQRQLSKIR